MRSARAVIQPMKLGTWRMLGKRPPQAPHKLSFFPNRLFSSLVRPVKMRLSPNSSLFFPRANASALTRVGEGSLPSVSSLDRQISGLWVCASNFVHKRLLATDAVVASTEPVGMTTPLVEKKPNPRHNAQHHDFPRARAVLRRFRTSMKKLNLVCRLVRRARVDAALMQLSLTRKRVADKVRRCIHDAKFNAANIHGMMILCTLLNPVSQR